MIRIFNTSKYNNEVKLNNFIIKPNSHIDIEDNSINQITLDKYKKNGLIEYINIDQDNSTLNVRKRRKSIKEGE